jgi:predicted ATPase/DNA-binding SARP family transcriptional activator
MSIRVRLIGTVAVDRDGVELAIGGAKQRLVLAVLALAAGDRVSTDRIVDLVWDASPPASARRTVQSYVATLRSVLGADGPLSGSGAGYVLEVERAQVDLLALEDAVIDALALVGSDPRRAAGVLGETDGLRSDLLWGLELPDGLRALLAPFEELQLQAVEGLATARIDSGQAEHAVRSLERSVREHPTREHLWFELARGLATLGRRDEALRAVQRAREALRSELGVDPSAQLNALEISLLQGQPSGRRVGGPSDSAVIAHGPDQDIPQAGSPDAFVHNLPPQLTEFVGRIAETAALEDLLRKRSLVTLTGVGGIGKTRLALQVGAGLGGGTFDAVYFVDLAPVEDPDMVEATTASAVGAPTGLPLVHFLRDWAGLLIVDNCEHLIDACADLVHDVRSTCPDVTVLATSRGALDLEGEQIVPVGPLQPETDGVELFLARARLLDPAYDVDDATRLVVADLCARLDGIPLAVELAAARSHELSPRVMVSNLDDRLTLFAGRRRRSGRHDTLQAAIDWSHDLLSEPARLLFRRLSVFCGAVSVEEIEGVCGDELLAVSRVGPLLRQLVDRNLVVARPGDPWTLYSMLETIRVYANDRLIESAEHRLFRDRHLDLYLDRSADLLSSPEAVSPVHLSFQLLNAASALDHAFDTDRHRSAVDLYTTWVGQLDDGSNAWAERRDRAESAAASLGPWATARVRYADIERFSALGRPDDAFAQAEELFANCSPGDFDPPDESESLLRYWPWLLLWQAAKASADDPARSQSICDQASELGGDDRWLELGLSFVRALALLGAGSSAEALDLLESASVYPHAVGVHIGLLNHLGRHDEAAARLPELDRVLRGGGLFRCYESYGAVAEELAGRQAEADRRIEIALRFASAYGSAYFASLAFMGLGAIRRERGDHVGARRFLSAAMSLDTGAVSHLRVFLERHVDQLGRVSIEDGAKNPDPVDLQNLAAVLNEGVRLIRP